MHSRTPSVEFFRSLELQRTRAIVLQDLSTVEALHAPEYQLITPAGRVFTRERYMAAIAAGPFYAAWDCGLMDVRASPKMAVVRYQASLAFPSGKVVHCWHTDTYELRSGAWLAVWSQATQLPGEHATEDARA